MVMPTATISSSLSGVSTVASTAMLLARLISLPQLTQQFAIVHNRDRVIIATSDVIGDCAFVRLQQVLDVQYTIRVRFSAAESSGIGKQIRNIQAVPCDALVQQDQIVVQRLARVRTLGKLQTRHHILYDGVMPGRCLEQVTAKTGKSGAKYSGYREGV